MQVETSRQDVTISVVLCLAALVACAPDRGAGKGSSASATGLGSTAAGQSLTNIGADPATPAATTAHASGERNLTSDDVAASNAIETEDSGDVRNSSAFAILDELHQQSQREIEAGATAQRRARSRPVRHLAKLVVHDRRAIDRKVVAFCEKRKIDFGAADDAEAEPTAQRQQDFDVEYARAIAARGARDIASVSRARAMSDDEGLDVLLDEVLLLLQKHEKVALKILRGRGQNADDIGNP